MSFIYKRNRGIMKKFIVSILVLVFLLLQSGCGDKSKAADTEVNEKKTVTDHMGREVVLPDNYDRILALNPLMMEGLFAIGITPVGKVNEYKIREEGIALPSVGFQRDINVESIYELKPNLILAHKRNQGQIIQALEDTGAVVYVFDPAKFGDNPMLDSSNFLGELLDRKEEAKKYAELVNKKAETLKEKIQKESDIKSAVIIQDGDTIRAAQNATAFGSIINGLGLTNIVPDNLPGSSKEAFLAFDIETIIEKDPDIILILASSKDKEQNKKVIQKYKNDPKWAKLTAVKKNRIKMLPFKVSPGRAKAEDMLQMAAEVILSDKKQK